MSLSAIRLRISRSRRLSRSRLYLFGVLNLSAEARLLAFRSKQWPVLGPWLRNAP